MAEPMAKRVARGVEPQRRREPTSINRLPRTQKIVDINSLVASFERTTFAPAMLRLPNEMLDRIASFLVPATEVHNMEGMGVCRTAVPRGLPGFFPAKSSASKSFQRELSNLRNMALVCRNFRPVVERVLYRNICLVQPEMGSTVGASNFPVASLPYLVRTMFDRPDLAARILSLKVWIRDRRLVSHTTGPGLHSSNLYYEVFKAACAHLAKIQMSFSDLIIWSKELHDYQELALHAILIDLLPNLEHLDLNWPYHHPMIWTWSSQLDTERPVSEIPNYSCLDVVLGRSSLVSIHFGSYFLPIRIFPVASLTTLTMDYLSFGDRTNWNDHAPMLLNVHTVNVTLDVAFSKLYDIDGVYSDMHPREGLELFLENSVPNLEHLALEPPKGTEPYVGQLTGRWGEDLAPTRLDKDPQDLEDDPLRESLFGYLFWDGLLELLSPVRNRLLHLTLPPNWYSSSGRTIKPMPTLQSFRRLQTLRLPNVALISNPHSEDYDSDEHDTHAVSFLPRSLETFVVTQANTETCIWLQEGFGNIQLLPGLKEVQLHFREDYWAIFPDGFEEAAQKAGVRVVAHWKGGTRVV